jgi:hypothetical protein
MRYPGVASGKGQRAPGRLEELQLAIDASRLLDGQQRRWPLVVPLTPARNEGRSEALPGSVESAFLALQAGENLPLPALPDALNPDRGEIGCSRPAKSEGI